MPKAVFVAPGLNTAEIPDSGAMVVIKEVRIVKDQWTSIGTVGLGLGVSVEYNDEAYSQLFSLDKEVLAGSVGRLLVSVGINDTDDRDFEKKVRALVGKQVKVIRKGGKIYWYP